MTAAIELARRGIACRIVDPLVDPPQYAKAVGVQPRTLEVFEGMGVLRDTCATSWRCTRPGAARRARHRL
jgi:2-polyprenyl-6-methoxyphenol hydroxylase-like FAD-dependent oxidoreductase